MNKSFIVFKFGGACLANSNKVNQAISAVKEELKNSDTKIIIVLSAILGVTNLIRAAISELTLFNSNNNIIGSQIKSLHNSFIQDYPFLEQTIDFYLDKLELNLQNSRKSPNIIEKYFEEALVIGEKIICAIFSSYLDQLGFANAVLTPEELNLETNGKYFNAEVNLTCDFTQLKRKISEVNGITIIPGFYGVTNQGVITTFGRSGSDYTATIIGHIMEASKITIWKEVDGIMTADPNLVKESINIPNLTYDEAIELATHGAQVLHPLAIFPAKLKNIIVEVKNLNNGISTKIGNLQTSSNPISFVSYIKNIVVIQAEKLSRMSNDDWIIQFTDFCNENDISLLFCSVSDDRILFTTKGVTLNHLQKLKNELKLKKIKKLKTLPEYALITLDYYRSRNYFLNVAKIITILIRNSIKILTSQQWANPTSFSVIVSQNDLKLTLNLIHKEILDITR